MLFNFERHFDHFQEMVLHVVVARHNSYHLFLFFFEDPKGFFLEVLVHASSFLRHFWFTPYLLHGECKIKVNLLHIHEEKFGNHVYNQLKYQILKKKFIQSYTVC